MGIPTGTGFLIWQVASVLPITRTIETLRRANASWVSIKIADGTMKWNQIREDGRDVGNDAFLLEFIAALQAAGFHVGGWCFNYPLPTLSPGAQAGVAGERYQKLGLQHLMVDAEQVAKVRAYWKFLADGTLNPQRARSATTYMNQLRTAGISLAQPVALCSYRFPSVHGEFPFPQFVNHDSSNFIAPQMYWIGSHNPAAQLARSFAEYNAISNRTRPMIPIGATFAEGSWQPTVEDLIEFMTAVKAHNMPGCGFYSLDWIMTRNRMDWVDAIAGVSEPPPPPPPPPPAPVPTVVEVVGLGPEENERLRMRAGIWGQVVGYTFNGAKFRVEGIGEDPDGRRWYRIGETIWIASWYTKDGGTVWP